jgi:hypothetical protein
MGSPGTFIHSRMPRPAGAGSDFLLWTGELSDCAAGSA